MKVVLWRAKQASRAVHALAQALRVTLAPSSHSPLHTPDAICSCGVACKPSGACGLLRAT